MSVKVDGATWTAKSAKYNTTSRYDDGPQEMQVMEAARRPAAEIVEASKQITGSIHYTAKALPELDRKLQQYVGVVLHGKPGDPDDLLDDIMDISMNIYKKNFENGFNVDPFSWGAVIGYSVLIGMGGAGIGLGADRLLNHFEQQRLARRRERDEYRL